MSNTPDVASANVDAWQNSTLITGDVLDGIATLKAQPGKDIGITGSATLVQSLLDAGLLDELRLLVHPIVVGHGKRLFRQEAKQSGLKLVDSKTFSTGVLFLIYQLDRTA